MAEQWRSVVGECFLGGLSCGFLLVEQSFETTQLLLHVLVDLQVTCHDDFHFLNVVVNVAVLRVLALDVLNQFTLFSDHMCDFFEVLEVVRSELFLLFHDVVDFLVEG